MMIQLPSGSSDQPGPRDAEGCSTFEAGLRRDLASAPIVSYDVMLGGVAKRALDLALTLATLPLWLPVLAGSAAWAKLRHGRQVFVASERIGYGGRTFKCLALQMAAPPAKPDADGPPGEPGAAEASPAISDRAQSSGDRWRRGLGRLPQFFNVIAGDMALVGPRPLTREQLEPLRTARRYYLSARPGIFGVHALSAGQGDDPSQYKTYAMAWSLTADALILSDQLRSLWSGGGLRWPVVNMAKVAAWLRRRRAAGTAPETPAQDTL